jgi:hypothetical protein
MALLTSKEPSRIHAGDPTWEIAHLFPAQGTWSEEDYLGLAGNHLVEFTDGVLEVLPMPSTPHQALVAYLYGLLFAYVSQKDLGKVLFAPLLVRLRPGKFREPDLVLMLKAHYHRIAVENPGQKLRSWRFCQECRPRPVFPRRAPGFFPGLALTITAWSIIREQKPSRWRAEDDQRRRTEKMRRLFLTCVLVAAGCQNVVGPFQHRDPQRVDDPLLTIGEQERRGRDRLALPEQSPAVAPPTYLTPTDPTGR